MSETETKRASEKERHKTSESDSGSESERVAGTSNGRPRTSRVQRASATMFFAGCSRKR